LPEKAGFIASDESRFFCCGGFSKASALPDQTVFRNAKNRFLFPRTRLRSLRPELAVFGRFLETSSFIAA